MKARGPGREPKKQEYRTVTVPVKLSPAEKKQLDRLAQEFTCGVRSLFMRAAFLRFRPTRKDFVG